LLLPLPGDSIAGMANVEKLSVALTPDMVAELRAAVEGGDYGSVSEVVREALRDWRLRRKIETLETEELRRLVREGMDSGPGLAADTEFARLRARFGQPRTLAAAIAESDADPRTVPHEKVRAWLLRLTSGEFDAPPPEPR
jgi:antitoxin ParD1/3/4